MIDDLFALAEVARADAIVSGDGHLTGLTTRSPAALRPRQFLERLAKEDAGRVGA